MSYAFSTYCRLCARSKSTSKLIDLNIEVEKHDEILSKLARLNASPSLFRDDILPKTVCYVCLSSLNAAFDFIVAIEQAQKSLYDIFFIRDIKKETLLDTDNEFVIEIEANIGSTQIGIKQELDSNESAIEQTTENITCTPQYAPNDLLHKPKKKLKNLNKTNSKDIKAISSTKLTWKDYIWTCSICGTQFSSIQELKTHSLKYHECCNAYRCTDCKRRKFKLDKFIIHVKRHRKYLKYSCYFCFAVFKSSLQVNRHKSIHLDSKHVCLGCNTSFSNVEELINHTSTFNRENKLSKTILGNQPDSLTCYLCDKTFNNKYNLNKHLVIHTERPRDHTCDKCGKCFFNKQTLIGHMLLHDDARPYQCVICNFGFKTKSQLRSHVGVHDGKKPYPCEQCGRCFRLQKQLNAHSIVHTDSLPFACTFCNKCFRFKSILNQHIRQHTGVKPYSCSICQRNFMNWPNYNKHMKRLHGTDMSKKKHTPAGVFPVNPSTGDIVPYVLSDNTEEWKTQIITSGQKKPGRPTLKSKIKKVNSSEKHDSESTEIAV